MKKQDYYRELMNGYVNLYKRVLGELKNSMKEDKMDVADLRECLVHISTLIAAQQHRFKNCVNMSVTDFVEIYSPEIEVVDPFNIGNMHI